MSRALLLLLLALTLLGCAHRGRRDQLSLQEQYELGERLAKRGSYVKALEQFNRIRNYHRDDPLALKAELAIADVHYRKNEWDLAAAAYRDFQRLHPRHEELDFVAWRLGMTSYKKAPRAAGRDQYHTRAAAEEWAVFERSFSESEHRVEALEKREECIERLAHKELLIAEFYERRQAWVAVEGRARRVLNLYPGSPDEGAALLLLAQSYAGQGKEPQVAEVLARITEKHPELREKAESRVERARRAAEKQ